MGGGDIFLTLSRVAQVNTPDWVYPYGIPDMGVFTRDNLIGCNFGSEKSGVFTCDIGYKMKAILGRHTFTARHFKILSEHERVSWYFSSASCEEPKYFVIFQLELESE